MGRTGEQRVFQKIFPIAGELAAIDERDLARIRARCSAYHEKRAAKRERTRLTKWRRLYVERSFGAHKAEPRFTVVGHDFAGYRAPSSRISTPLASSRR